MNLIGLFTSPTTITAIKEFHPDFINNLNCKIAVIGRKTAEDVENHGLKVDLIPEDYTAEGLLKEFQKRNIKIKLLEFQEPYLQEIHYLMV